MKTHIIAISILIILVNSSVTISATAQAPAVRLPTDMVTMLAEYSTNSWFDMTLSDVPAGYDVVNGHYLGWCAQKSMVMRRGVNHSVTLYSSYDSTMPEDYQCAFWDKINYVLNHKQGNRENIEKVIWYYTCNEPYPSSDPISCAMINETEVNSHDFIPQPGSIIAILVDGVDDIQRTFFELSLPSEVPIGDLVWNDLDADGIQDAREPGVAGITVQMYSQNQSLVTSDVTDQKGYYAFSNFVASSYYLQVLLPAGYRFSPQDQGSDDTKDSDVNIGNGQTIFHAFDPLRNETWWDAGIYKIDQSENSNQLGSPGQYPSVKNHAPTADGTASEPYKGLTGEAIRFDGSRSYDRDGTITSALWDFGDGITQEGMTITHVYTNPGTYKVRFTVTDNDGATDTYETAAYIKVPNRPPSQLRFDGPFTGHAGVTYVYSIVASDADGDNIRYVIIWDDSSQSTSPLFKNDRSITLTHTWDVLGFYDVSVVAIDESNASSDVLNIRVSIDVLYLDDLGYFVNSDGQGPFDAFYSNQTGNLTALELQENGEYLIDVDGDGSFEYQSNLQPNALQNGPGALGTEYMLLLIGTGGTGVVIFLMIVFSLLTKRKKGKTKEPENAVEEVPPVSPET